MNRASTAAQVLASQAGRCAVECGDVGALIRLVREALGWTQADLGRESGYSQPTISRLENNAGRMSDISLRARLADILEIPHAAVGLVGQVIVEDMDRADLLRGAVAGAASLALPTEITAGPRSRIGAETVRGCDEALSRLYKLDDRLGGATVYALTTRMVGEIRTALGQATYSAEVGRALRRVAAATAEHAGWLAFDTGRPDDARRWWLEALHLADLAGDPEVRMIAMLSMSLHATTGNNPADSREAIDVLDAARRSAGALLSPRLSSLIDARQAIAHARNGSPDAAHRAVLRAERSLGSGDPTADGPAWLGFWGAADLNCHKARTFLALGQTRQAEQAAAAAMAAGDEERYPRNQTMYAAVRARALAESGRVDAAIAAATPVVARAGTLRSRRIVTEARRTVRLVSKHQRYGPAASFVVWANRLLPAT